MSLMSFNGDRSVALVTLLQAEVWSLCEPGIIDADPD